MSSVIVSAMQKEPIQVAVPTKDAIQCSKLEKPKLTVSNDGFVDLSDWNTANQLPSSPLHSGRAKQVSNAAQTVDSEEPLVGKSWLTLKKNLQRKINNKRQQGLNCRYELWKEDQQRSALSEEKLLYAFVEEDDSLKHNLDDSFSEDDADGDDDDPSENNVAPTESEPLQKLDSLIDSGNDIQSEEPLVDDKPSESLNVNLRSPWADENESDDQSEVSFNFVPRAVVSSDDEDDDSNCNALPCPTLNADSAATAATPPQDSHAEAELSVSDLFAKPSNLSSDLALANLFFDDSKQEGDSFSANASAYNATHISQSAELSLTHDSSLSPKQFSHREELLNFRIPQNRSSVDLNCNTESLSLENLCSGEFPDSGDQVAASSRSKSRSSLAFDRLDTTGMPSPVDRSKKTYHGIVLDNDYAEDDLELLCSAPFASSPKASKEPSSYRLEDVLDENARDGYPESTPLENVAKKNPDLFDTGEENDSNESDAEIDLLISSTSKHHEGLRKSRKKLLNSEFLDVEAELSGSDDSGDEEDVDDGDDYEDDFIDRSNENLKTDGELRTEIGKIQNKQLIEEDARMINLFKEKLLDSREVRTGLRHRRMGWAAAREESPDAQLNEDKEDPSEMLVDDSLSRWQMALREKAEWLLEQEHPLNIDDSETESNTASVIFGYGMQACNSTNSSSRQFSKAPTVVSIVEDGSIALTASRVDSRTSESLLKREQTKLELAFGCTSESNDSKNNAYVPLPPSEGTEECQSQLESIPLQKRRRMAAEQRLETVFRQM